MRLAVKQHPSPPCICKGPKAGLLLVVIARHREFVIGLPTDIRAAILNAGNQRRCAQDRPQRQNEPCPPPPHDAIRIPEPGPISAYIPSTGNAARI